MNFDTMMGYFATLHFLAYTGLDANDESDIEYAITTLASKQVAAEYITEETVGQALDQFYAVQEEVEKNLSDA